MFGRRHFGGAFWGPRFFGGGAAAETPGAAGSGGMFGRAYFGGRYWGSRYWGGGDVTAAPTATFLEALRAFLLADDTLADLTDVYLHTAPPGSEYPHLVISRLYQTPFLNTEDSYHKEVGVQFTAFSQDAAEAETLGDAAYDALFPFDGHDPLEFAEGYEMTRLPGTSRGPTADARGPIAGDPVWRQHFDYTFLVGKD